MSVSLYRHEDGSVSSTTTGETFQHRCELGGRPLWVDDEGVRTLFARVVLPATVPPRVLRLKVEKGVLKAARDLKPADNVPESIGQAVWPLPTEIGEAPPPVSPVGPAEIRAAAAFEPAAVIEFAGRNYEIDAASVVSRVTELPDETRVALHVTASGRVLATAILRDEPRDAPHGFAKLVPTGSALALASSTAAEAPAESLAFAPPSPETLSSLFATGTDALDPAAIKSPLANPPILFFAFGHEEQTAEGISLVTHSCRGIVLGLFRVPDSFGSPNTERAPDGTIIEKERVAAWILTTAAGVIVSSRDQKLVPAPAGSVVWVDVKSDLRPICRYAPKLQDGRLVSASEMFIRPTGKRRYEHTLPDGKKEPRYPWRIELKWIRTITDPAQLAAIAAAAVMVPELPGGDEMDLAPPEAGDGF